MDRLARAMAVVEDWRRGGSTTSAADLLNQHADLSEFIAPLLGVSDDLAASGMPAGENATGSIRALGARFGRYRLVREVGRGGMGVVYEAIQLDLHRKVALKVLPAHLTLRPDAIARFRREAMTAARLEHRGIVQVHDVGDDGDAHWFAMELIDGQPLDQVIELARLARAAADGADEATSAALPTRDAVRLVADVADALAFAHGAGVLHRDVKPSNILRRVDGTPVLTDFGLAREAGLPSLTEPGGLAGTPFYVSPEQVRGAVADARSDVFSLGVTLYELLTLTRPFHGETSAAVLQQILRRDPVAPQRRNPELPADLGAVVLKALEKEPSRRYPSAVEFADDLRAFLAHRPVSARPLTRLGRVRRWVRRAPVHAALAGVAVLLVTIAIYAWRAQSRLAASEREEANERLLAEGFLHYSQRDADAARAAFTHVLAISPDHDEAQLGRLLALHMVGSTEQVLEELQRLPRVAATPAGRRFALWLRQQRGDPEATLAEDALGPPRDALDAFLMAGVAHDAGNVQPAQHLRVVELYETAMLLSPRPRSVFAFSWAQAVGRLGDARRAAQCSSVLQRFWPDAWMSKVARAKALAKVDHAAAAALARAATEQQPQQAFGWSALGSCLEIAGDNAGAAEAYAKAAEIRPRVEDFINLSIVRARHGDVAGSNAAEDRAIALQREHPGCLHILGVRAAQGGELGEAVALLTRAAEFVGYTSRAQAYYDLGVAHRMVGNKAGERAAYERCIEFRPFAMAQANLANILRAEGDYALAEQHYQEARRLEPDLMQAWQGLVLCHYERKQFEDLLALTRTWQQAQPRMPEAWYWHARGSRESGACAASAAAANGAVDSARKACELTRRQHPKFLHELGVALENAGDNDGARAALEEAEVLTRKPAFAVFAAPVRGALDRLRAATGR